MWSQQTDFNPLVANPELTQWRVRASIFAFDLCDGRHPCTYHPLAIPVNDKPNPNHSFMVIKCTQMTHRLAKSCIFSYKARNVALFQHFEADSCDLPCMSVWFGGPSVYKEFQAAFHKSYLALWVNGGEFYGTVSPKGEKQCAQRWSQLRTLRWNTLEEIDHLIF